MKAASGVLYDLIKGRRSIRRFHQQAVDEQILERILRAACRAPSAHNRQPWRFVVLDQGSPRQRLVESMSARFRADLEADGLPESEIEKLVKRGRQRLLEAPVAIFLFLTMEDMDQYPDDRRQRAEQTMAIQSVALAGGHMLLAAHAEGLGACWVCAPLFVPDLVRHELDLEDGWLAQGVILLGNASEPGRDRNRRPVAEVALWR